MPSGRSIAPRAAVPLTVTPVVPFDSTEDINWDAIESLSTYGSSREHPLPPALSDEQKRLLVVATLMSQLQTTLSMGPHSQEYTWNGPYGVTLTVNMPRGYAGQMPEPVRVMYFIVNGPNGMEYHTSLGVTRADPWECRVRYVGGRLELYDRSREDL